MKTLIMRAGLALLAAVPTAHSDPSIERSESLCYRVTIQSERVNSSDVHQDCGYNVSRTAQVGAWNEARTRQTGRINSNGVRQFHFDGRRYLQGPSDRRWQVSRHDAW